MPGDFEGSRYPKKDAVEQKIDDLIKSFDEYKGLSRDDFHRHEADGKERFGKGEERFDRLEAKLGDVEKKAGTCPHDDHIKEQNGSITTIKEEIQKNAIVLAKLDGKLLVVGGSTCAAMIGIAIKICFFG